LKKRNEMRH